MDYQTIPFHLFSLFFLDSILYLPVEDNFPNSELNAVHFGNSPISFITESFEASGEKQLNTDIETIFLAKYKDHFANLISQKGSDYVKAKLFIESGRNIMKSLEKKLKTHFSTVLGMTKNQKEQMITNLLIEADDQIFKVGDYRVMVQGIKYPNLRIQIEKLITGDQGSVEIIFYKLGFSIRLDKDDFMGYDIKIWSKIRGLTQSYITDLRSRI